jgi:hypothetical protein
MDQKQKNEYIVPFKGAKLSKRDANKIGLGLALGFAGAVISVLLFGSGNRRVAVIFVLVFAAFGYFFIGNRTFRR